MDLVKKSSFVSFVLWVVVLMILLQGFCVEAGKKNDDSVIVINAGGGQC